MGDPEHHEGPGKPPGAGLWWKSQSLPVISPGEDPPADKLAAVLDSDGKLSIPLPAVLASLGPVQRVNVLLWGLWLDGAAGRIEATKEYLRHHRWAKELRTGRAPQRTTVDHKHSGIVVIDNLTGGKSRTIDASVSPPALLPSPPESFDPDPEAEPTDSSLVVDE